MIGHRITVFAALTLAQFTWSNPCSAANEQKKPVVAVLAEPALRDASSLITAALANQDSLALVEREDLDKVLREQKWTAGGWTRDRALHLGELLGADGLLLVKSDRQNTHVSLRLVSVRHGVVLSHQTYATEVFTEEGIRTVVLPMLHSLWPKLKLPQGGAIPISLGGLHSVAQGIGMQSLERELSLLLERRLVTEPSLFVLERRSMEMLMAEKDWAGQDQTVLTGHVLMEGNFEIQNDRLTIHLQVQPPDRKSAMGLMVEGPRSEQASLVNELADKILAALKTAPAEQTWNTQDEANVYRSIARWALDHQLFTESRTAAETAWALGARGNDLNEIRMKAWGMEAYPMWGTTRMGIMRCCYSFHGVDVRKEPERLESAIRAVEILADHLQTEPRTEQEYSSFHDRGESNHDYRILSARVLLNASRLLRSFYEDDACAGHHDRLAYLRELIRFCLDELTQDAGAPDDRQLWIYKIQSAYAAYLYESPEDTVRIYQSLLDRNIKGWLISRDPADTNWGPECSDKNDGCIRHRFAKNPYHTAFAIDWDPAQEGRAAQVWSEFLTKLQQSEKPHEQAAAWVFLAMKKLPNALEPSLHAFVWQHRAQMADVQKSHFIWQELGAFFPNTKPSKEECSRMFEYLMREGTMVDTLFAQRLLDEHALSDDDVRKFRLLFDSYLKRAQADLPKDIAHKHIAQAKQWIGQSFSKSHREWIANGYRQPVERRPPARLPKAAPDALPVTRYWNSWFGMQGELTGTQVSGHCYMDGKIWCFNTDKKSKVLGIDLSSLAVTEIDVPAQQYRHVRSLAAGGGRLFATWDGLVHVYDFTTKAWAPISVPKDSYTLRYIEPYCYLMFGKTADSGAKLNGSPDAASGVMRYDASTGEIQLLASTRRRPALSNLDELGPYEPLHVEQGKDGTLYLILTKDRYGEQQEMYKAGPDGMSWTRCFSVTTDSPPWIESDAGGLLCESGTRSYRYFPNLGEHNRMWSILVQADNNDSPDPSLSDWTPPQVVVKQRKSRGIVAATSTTEGLWLLSTRGQVSQGRHFKADPILHFYAPGKREATDTALYFPIPQPEQEKLRELAGNSSDIDQVAESQRQTVVLRAQEIHDVIPVPDGFVFSSGHGFWHLSHAQWQQHARQRK